MCGSRVEITDVMFKSISRIMAKMIWLPRENGFPSSRQSKISRNLSSCSTIYAHLHFSWLDCQIHCAKNSVSFRSLNILSSTFCFDNFCSARAISWKSTHFLIVELLMIWALNRVLFINLNRCTLPTPLQTVNEGRSFYIRVLCESNLAKQNQQLLSQKYNYSYYMYRTTHP